MQNDSGLSIAHNTPANKTASWLSIGALLMALAVGLGAFGAHGIRGRVSETDFGVYQTAALYHLIHALGIIGTALAGCILNQSRTTHRICTLFLFSIFVFSGSLYTLVLTQQRWLGAITPLGGTGFICGWIWLAVLCFRCSRRSNRTNKDEAQS